MSYTIGEDGQVTFQCHGCDTTKQSKALAALPKGWCVTGVLVSCHHEEFRDEGDTVPTDEKLREVNEQLAAHFCSIKCAKKKLLQPKVREYVEKMGVTLVLYGKCETIVDGTTPKEEGRLARKKKYVHPENRPDENVSNDDEEPPRGDGGPGLGKPKSPPPYRMGDGGSPI